ncbi:hypothetical protein HRI_001061200 [Hibiscus trionum]|uniref:F-box domain-containing protein n=1 Tax=Hibiscus trionum TaxID=183268 RepID=A0A9W7HAG0_HIBTR|nr:hypothetical protein HRI_001061200 [Hibiscus trionum]
MANKADGGQKEDAIIVLQNNKEERDWSKLPEDIIGHIAGKLYWSDRIRIRAVCKNWQQVTLEFIPTIDRAAWLMTYRWLRLHPSKGLIGERKLRDTSLGKVIYIDKDIAVEAPDIFCEYQCETTRYGWVLLQKAPPFMCRRFFFLLYSPFTDEVIELPVLDVGLCILSMNLKSTFYLSSKNSECLVFTIHTHTCTTSISTCRPGDKNWKTYNFVQTHPIDWERFPLSATYIGGCFYCVFSGGALGVFHLGRQEWELLVKRWPDSVELESHLFGELVATPRFQCRPRRRKKVMKFDFSAKCWVENLKFREKEHPDLRFLSSSQSLGESSTDHHLYAYLYMAGLFTSNSSPHLRYHRYLILIEPPLKRVWRRHHLLNRD